MQLELKRLDLGHTSTAERGAIQACFQQRSCMKPSNDCVPPAAF